MGQDIKNFNRLILSISLFIPPTNLVSPSIIKYKKFKQDERVRHSVPGRFHLQEIRKIRYWEAARSECLLGRRLRPPLLHLRLPNRPRSQGWFPHQFFFTIQNKIFFWFFVSRNRSLLRMRRTGRPWWRCMQRCGASRPGSWMKCLSWGNLLKGRLFFCVSLFVVTSYVCLYRKVLNIDKINRTKEKRDKRNWLDNNAWCPS